MSRNSKYAAIMDVPTTFDKLINCRALKHHGAKETDNKKES